MATDVRSILGDTQTCPSAEPSPVPQISRDEIFLVKPALSIPAQKTTLPACDQVGIPIMLTRIMCFSRDASLSHEHLVEALKAATAGTIAEIPHLCGKISLVEKVATRKVQLEIPEDTSVVLKIRQHPDKAADEMESLGWPPHMLRREELTLSKYPIKAVGTFNFALQANVIRGGLILTMHINHMIFDGYALALVEVVLAHHLSRAISGKSFKPSPITTPATLDKAVAWASHPARPILDWPDWRPAPPQLPIPEGFSEEDLMRVYVSTMEDFAVSIWRFSPQQQDLLRRAGQKPGNSEKLSLASCLHSFLWKVYVRARQHDDGETRSMCLQPVQTRGRIEELPKFWSGSAIVYGRAEATVKEVMDAPSHVLGQRIEAGTARWTPEAIREYWGSIEDCPDVTTVEPNTDRQNGPDVEFSNISNVPYYKLDWGSGLDIRSWRCTELAFTDGYTLITPRKRNGDLEVIMYMTKDGLANAMGDREFRQHAEFVCAGDANLEIRAHAWKLEERARL